MPIKHWPKEDQPREKLLHKGEQMLTDAELLAIFIKTGIPGKSALDIARELLIEYGNLKAILRASAPVLIKTAGIGYAKYASLKAACELGRRFLQETIIVGETLNNSLITQRFLASRLQGYENEVFACLFLDNHLRLLCFEELFHGTINEANVYPREIVRRGLVHNAAKVILAHNHPSGNPEPSIADQDVTQLIKQALSLVDIEIVDHVIIGHGKHFSFADKGIM